MSRASAGLSSSQAHSPSPDPDPLMTFTTLTKRNDLRLHPEVTAFSSAKLVETAQRTLDLEIRKYQDSIRGLQYRRNALSPIGRLPPEMLSRIFLFCSDPESLSWIKEVSHICRHWRAVALGCPNLWSVLVFAQPKWADEMLKRSKMAPLTVKADLTYMTPRMVNTVHSSLTQISRIGELEVKTGSRSVPEILNLTDTAPYLHSLSLASPGFAQEEHFTLPNNFLNAEAPRLRRLELTRFFLPWDSPLLSNLFHLKIQNPGPTARPSMKELLGVLERMPQLETLELDNALPVLAPEVSTLSMPSSRIPLSHLKRFVIANVSALECADTLNRLSFNGNSGPTMKVSCLADNSTIADFSILISSLSNVQSVATTRQLRSLFVNIGFGGMTIRAWSCFVQSGDPPRGRPFLEFDFKWLRFLRDDSEELMAYTCRSLPMRGLRGLSLSTDIHEVETKTWINTFASLPTLLSIHLRGQSTQLIAALGEEVIIDGVRQIPPPPAMKLLGRRASLRRPRAASVSGGLFFPALRNLILEDTDFAGPALDTLETALMERCERKQELWTLTLQDCNRLRYEDVERLKDIVSDVTWDGLELGFSEDESEADMSEFGDFYGGGFYYHGDEMEDSDYDYPIF
ncbi:F-box domain-containing protein [Mycena venus]|uniref:F-box domain-containing protein n=1 Tax=Mycena venus TaxID=2733690 RepID=A0A8H6YCP5_9AGAR|nr:F-box domain-containing protein [Mycena venus]